MVEVARRAEDEEKRRGKEVEKGRSGRAGAKEKQRLSRHRGERD